PRGALFQEQVAKAIDQPAVARVERGRRVRLLDDGRALEDRARGQEGAVVDRAVHEPLALGKVDRPGRFLHSPGLAAADPVAQPGFRDPAQGGQPHVDPLDRLRRRMVPVGPLVLAVERLHDAGYGVGTGYSAREWDRQLETLPDVTQVGVGLED